MENNLKSLQQRFFEKTRTLPQDSLSPHSHFPLRGEDRTGIYRTAHFLRIQESLDDDFPLLKEEMGEEHFETLLSSFIRATPSEYSSLAEFSGELPKYLSALPGSSTQLIDLAELDFALIRVSYFPHPEKFDFSMLAQMEPDQVPKLQIKMNESALILKNNCVFQGFEEAEYLELDAVSLKILNKVLQGTTIAGVTEFAEMEHLNEARLFATFQTWAAVGLIVGCE